jgi:hypothetical protein
VNAIRFTATRLTTMSAPGWSRLRTNGWVGAGRADGLGAFLSTGTPANASVYQRCGFQIVGHLDAPGGGPHIWFMRSSA